MVTKSQLMIRVLAGGYLSYLGGKLLMDAVKERPDNYIIFALAGLAFLVIGIFLLGKSAIKLQRKEYEDNSIIGQISDDEPEDKTKVKELEEVEQNPEKGGTDDESRNGI
ncbi:MAG: hypothetical protein MR224_06695 [Dorea sp.]|nr:hypothetical protein [Dorea sp.]